MAPPIDNSREQNGHRLIARFADADARRMALHDRQVVVLELHADRHQSIAGVDPGPGRRRRWSLPDRVDRPLVETPRRASISVWGRIRSSDPPRRRPAAGTIMRRNGRPPAVSFVLRPRHPVLECRNENQPLTCRSGATFTTEGSLLSGSHHKSGERSPRRHLAGGSGDAIPSDFVVSPSMMRAQQRLLRASGSSGLRRIASSRSVMARLKSPYRA
jgi:hypothetical protein